MISKNASNKISRRNWLRGVAITATSAVLLPSFLTGCIENDDIPPVFGSTPPLTPAEFDLYSQAAENLIRMRKWNDNLFTFTGNYEDRVWSYLKGGEEPTNWTEIFVKIFTEIGLGILEAGLEEFPGLGPAIATTAKQVEKWELGEKAERGVDAAFGGFKAGYDDMMKEVSDNLLLLASSGTDNNFPYLQEAFKNGDIEFNGKKYSLKDLAQNRFPADDVTADLAQFEALRNAAFVRFKKYIWNAMIIQAGNMTYHHLGSHEAGFNEGGANGYVRDNYYNQEAYVGSYIRGTYNGPFDAYTFEEFYFEFDGKKLSADAAKELFIDTTPGHIIHPDKNGNPTTGLWPRDYVYKQFHKEKPDFFGYNDVSKDEFGHGSVGNRYLDFDESANNYVFTGGDFSELTNLG
ncbi:hypothetical protein I2I11_20835 [Pontibacter sp. 172403-2]|uniref:hypothetical protein n=1 Tax=Pontibacter rufus TaxID=2791028 RepID=UPI0018AFCABA|nr:hypothetical protein [Pontibacter sp. 172403-2]MBF9255757.1 hypothetical protein [Pontibacter sp. 172403-2]